MSVKEDDNHWFADVDPEYEGHEYLWQPCLQVPGACHSFDVWFATKEACEAYIRDEILGAPLKR